MALRACLLQEKLMGEVYSAYDQRHAGEGASVHTDVVTLQSYETSEASKEIRSPTFSGKSNGAAREQSVRAFASFPHAMKKGKHCSCGGSLRVLTSEVGLMSRGN